MAGRRPKINPLTRCLAGEPKARRERWVKFKMAALEGEAGVSESEVEDKSNFNEVVKLVWGETVNEDLLRRWSQGT